MNETTYEPTAGRPIQAINRESVPVYCLTKISDIEKSTLEHCITEECDEADRDNYWVVPQFILCDKDEDGDLQDLYRIWRDSGEDRYYNFAFVDREAVENKSIIIAQPGCLHHALHRHHSCLGQYALYMPYD